MGRTLGCEDLAVDGRISDAQHARRRIGAELDLDRQSRPGQARERLDLAAILGVTACLQV